MVCAIDKGWNSRLKLKFIYLRDRVKSFLSIDKRFNYNLSYIINHVVSFYTITVS